MLVHCLRHVSIFNSWRDIFFGRSSWEHYLVGSLALMSEVYVIEYAYVYTVYRILYIYYIYTVYSRGSWGRWTQNMSMFKHTQAGTSLSLSPYSLATEYHLCIFAYMKYVRFMIWIDWNTSEKIWACYNRRPVGPMQWPLPKVLLLGPGRAALGLLRGFYWLV